MKKRTKILVVGAAIGTAAVVPAIAQAGDDRSEGSEIDVPVRGPDLARASEVAIDHLGGGSVTETEIDDEESYYEVEVILDDGRQVDVQLDKDFNVVGTEDDGSGSDD